jgi:hypothetical protein
MINQVNECQITPQKMDNLAAGTMIYRNYDHQFITALNKSHVERKMSLVQKLTYISDSLALTLTDEDGVTVQVLIPYSLQAANDAPRAEDNIRKQLLKLGGTPFSGNQVEIDLPGPLFIPLSTLNLLRRSGIDKLIEARQNNHVRPVCNHSPNEIIFPSARLDFTSNVLNQNAVDFYHRHGVTSIDPAAESGINMQGRKVMTTRYCIKYQLGLCHRQKSASPVSGNLTLVDEDGNQFPLMFDCSRCQMEVYFNSYPE